MAAICSHLDTIRHVEGREGVTGCPACLAIGSTWVHLRRCTECGQVGCCDDSPNRHASAHHAESGHPVIRSIEPAENWLFCYEDQVAFTLGGVD
jgi:uncharacterized UBP type Zn finger protein